MRQRKFTVEPMPENFLRQINYQFKINSCMKDGLVPLLEIFILARNLFGFDKIVNDRIEEDTRNTDTTA